MRARQREDRANGARPAALEVERDQGTHERRRRIVDIRCAGTARRADLHQRGQGHARHALSRLEFDLPARDVEQSLAEGVGFERVGAAEIDRRAGRRFDEEQAGDRVHFGVDHTARQRQAMLGRARHDELHARFGPHFDLADSSDGDEGA